MKKFLFTVVCIICLQVVRSQTVPATPVNDSNVVAPVQTAPVNSPAKKQWSKIDLSNRSNDHFMLQYGFDNWSGTSDSTKPSGFSRFFNAYIMLDKPFKTNPRLSVGLGIGVGSSNIFFNKRYVDLKSTSSALPFRKVDSLNHFKKFKLTTVFLEAPVELRYSSDPENSNSSFKAAIGVKVGTLLSAYTKGKTLQDKNGNTLNPYIQKESSKKFINTTRLAVTGRVGFGIFSIYGAYQITSFLKDIAGPTEIRPYSIGLCISGL
ncbi:MAG: outer membrane beta-barrel protein [Segetibacter sp.]